MMLIYSPKHYSSIMPLLLNVLRNANGPDYRKLRVKAMECAGLIGMLVFLCKDKTINVLP